MNIDLYNRYGNYSDEGYFIIDYDKYHYYKQKPLLYEKEKRKAKLWMFFPFGFVFSDLIYEKMGLDIL